MKLTIDRKSCVPLYKQIAREIEDKIYSQELAAGYKLPSERRLAGELLFIATPSSKLMIG